MNALIVPPNSWVTYLHGIPGLQGRIREKQLANIPFSIGQKYWVVASTRYVKETIWIHPAVYTRNAFKLCCKILIAMQEVDMLFKLFIEINFHTMMRISMTKSQSAEHEDSQLMRAWKFIRPRRRSRAPIGHGGISDLPVDECKRRSMHSFGGMSHQVYCG